MTHRITLLGDGTAWADGGGAFGLVPRPKWVKLLPPDDQNRVPQALWCALVEADGQRILVDTGAGDKSLDKLAAQYALRRDNGHLLDALGRVGVTPDDIDLVIQTHLHGDHAGWCTTAGADGRLRPTFRRARYIVQAAEFEDATHPNERTRNTYFEENFVPLADAGALTLLRGAADLSPSVRVVPTPGHTLGHQSVVVTGVGDVLYPVAGAVRRRDAGGRPVILLGDLACYAVHFARLPWVTAYDVLPLLTIESKREVQRLALDHDAWVVPAHDSVQPVGVLTRDAKGFTNIADV